MSDPDKSFNDAGRAGAPKREDVTYADIYRRIIVNRLALNDAVRFMRGEHGDPDEAKDAARAARNMACDAMKEIDGMVQESGPCLSLTEARTIREGYEYCMAAVLDASDRLGVGIGYRFNQGPALDPDIDALDSTALLKRTYLRNLGEALRDEGYSGFGRIFFVGESLAYPEMGSPGADGYIKEHKAGSPEISPRGMDLDG